MQAVYYCKDSSPFCLMSIKIESNSEEEIRKYFESGEYPWPTSEVIVLDKDEVINEYWISKE